MKSLFEKPGVEELLKRLENITPQAQRQWGKMNVDQMLHHCSAGLDMASGREVPPFSIMGRIIGRFLKHMYSNDKPFDKGSPTSLKIGSNLDFEFEKKRLKETMSRFNQDGLAGATSKPHPFFGKLTPEAWGKGMNKHIDHHFKQFGV
jgi:hypothetical protein